MLYNSEKQKIKKGALLDLFTFALTRPTEVMTSPIGVVSQTQPNSC
jgi:hypothetical protein